MLIKLVMMFFTVIFNSHSVPKQPVTFGKGIRHKTSPNILLLLAGFDKTKMRSKENSLVNVE